MNNDLEQHDNSFTDSELEGMAHGNNPVTNAYRELLAFRVAAKQNKPTFDEWLSSRTDTIEVDCGCVTTEAFYHWLKVAYESAPQPVFIPEEKPHTDGLLADGWNACRAQMLYHTPQPSHTDQPIGEIRLSEYRSDGTREASVVCLHDQADWDNFTDGTLLYLNSQPAHTEQDGWISIPKEMLADYRDVKNGELQTYKASFGSHCDIPRSRWQRDLADLTEELAEIDKLIAAPKPESE